MRFIANVLRTVGLARGEDDALEIDLPGDAVMESEEEAPMVVERDIEPPDPTKLKTRHITLDALLRERLVDDVESQETSLAEALGLDATLAEIYAAGGVKDPEHGWSVDKVVELMAAAVRKSMPPSQIARTVEAALYDAGVDPREIAIDAVTRDEVLDLYEDRLVEYTRRAVGKMLHQLDDGTTQNVVPHRVGHQDQALPAASLARQRG